MADTCIQSTCQTGSCDNDVCGTRFSLGGETRPVFIITAPQPPNEAEINGGLEIFIIILYWKCSGSLCSLI